METYLRTFTDKSKTSEANSCLNRHADPEKAAIYVI